MNLFRKGVEPDSETIKKIYNRMSDIEHSQSILEAKLNTIKLKLNSLSGKVYREEHLEQNSSNRNEYIPQVIIPE
jgi:hypothetical protein